VRRYISTFKLIIFLFVLTTAYRAVAQTTWSRIEESSDWETCGNCGNTGASGATATFSMVRGVTSPNLDGSATEFKISGSTAYKNAYWYLKRYDGPSHPVTYVKYAFYIYVPSTYVNAPQGIEFHVQQKADGRIYDFAWQAEYPGHVWRTFNYALREWQSSGLAFAGFTGGKWHHVIAEGHAENGQVVHDALTIDGVRHALSIHQAAPATTSGTYITNSFQLDMNKSATDYHVYVDKMSVTWQ
jgi:hypothetical protein